MIPALLLLLAAAPTRVDLVDDTFEIPASDWRYVEVNLRQQPVTVGCDYALLSAGNGVRVALVTRRDLEQRRARRPWNSLALTPFAEQGRLRYRIRQPGQFAVLIDNTGPGSTPERVQLRVFLDFSSRREPEAQGLSRTRQLVVILVSFLFFLAVVSYSAHRLLRGIRRGS